MTTIKFEEDLEPFGDHERYLFINVANGDRIVVRVSRNAVEDLGARNPRALAAQMVKNHLHGRLTTENYVDGEINVTSYADLETTIEEFERFTI